MLILASRSPQRRAILEQIGVPFTVVESDAREIDTGDPAEVVVKNALLKARAVAAGRSSGEDEEESVAASAPPAPSPDVCRSGDAKSGDKATPPPTGLSVDELVLGADTVIAYAGEVIGKPANAEQAREVMRRLSGEEHAVLGGIAIVGPGRRERIARVSTSVRFRPLTEAEIDLYVATGEWRDRSGGYAIQQRGATLVERIEGDYLNIVGLSVVELLRLAPELSGGD